MSADLRRGVIAALRALDSVALVGSGRPTPEGAYPYVGCNWDITEGVALRGDAKVMWGAAEIQLDVWEKLEAEDGTVARQVKSGIDGLKFDDQRLSFRTLVRMDDEAPESGLVHTVITFGHRSPF